MPLSREEQHALVVEHLQLAGWVAWSIGKYRAAHWVDDLAQDARLGLLEAAGKFDPTKGVAFASYGTHFAKQHVRNAQRRYLDAGSYALPTDDEGEVLLPAADEPTPEEALEASQTHALVRKAVGELPLHLGAHGARDVAIFWRHYAQGETVPELAAAFELTPTRIHQVIAQVRPVFIGRLAALGFEAPGPAKDMTKVRKVDRLAEEAIRREYATGTVSQVELGERYGISQKHVSRIVRGLRRG